MAEKLDFKKEYKDLYLPKQKPMVIDVPAMTFIMVDGVGDPNDAAGEYPKAVGLLYGLSYTIKMSKMSGQAPAGYLEYVVPPLEGMWWSDDEVHWEKAILDKSRFHWTSMIRQPDFVTQDVFVWACEELKRKKPHLDTSKARIAAFTEGLCVQMMHLGPYDDEPVSITQMEQYIADNGYRNTITDVLPTGQILRHHEIYLSDPLKTSPEKLKTVLRHPVRKAET